jgi:predicted glycoside hydrolase/deacetylase ChbG (UPF0249 family)
MGRGGERGKREREARGHTHTHTDTHTHTHTDLPGVRPVRAGVEAVDWMLSLSEAF